MRVPIRKVGGVTICCSPFQRSRKSDKQDWGGGGGWGAARGPESNYPVSPKPPAATHPHPQTRAPSSPAGPQPAFLVLQGPTPTAPHSSARPLPLPHGPLGSGAVAPNTAHECHEVGTYFRVRGNQMESVWHTLMLVKTMVHAFDVVRHMAFLTFTKGRAQSPGRTWAATTRVSWALPWGAAWKFRGARGRGLSAQALETPGVTVSSSRIHRSTGEPGRPERGPGLGAAQRILDCGRPPLGQQRPLPRPEPGIAHCGGFWPHSRRSSRPRPCRPACALPATWTHPPMSLEDSLHFPGRSRRLRPRDFLGHSVNPADAPSVSSVEGVSTLPVRLHRARCGGPTRTV